MVEPFEPVESFDMVGPFELVGSFKLDPIKIFMGHLIWLAYLI